MCGAKRPLFWEALSSPWQACLDQAWQAALAGCIPIGAVVTDAADTILTRGRNHIDGPRPPEGVVFGTPLAHAELNALIDLHACPVDPHDCILYTTTEPCPLCLGAVYMSGVRSLHYAARDPYAGSVDLLGTTPYLSRKPVRAAGPQAPALEDLITALSVEHMLHRERRAWADNPVRAAWMAVFPQAVRLGEALYRAGLLRCLRQERASAAVMWAAVQQFELLQ